MEETKTCEAKAETLTAPPFVAARAFRRVARHLHGAICAFRDWSPLRGTRVATWPIQKSTVCMAVTPTNLVVVCDNNNHCVDVFSADGTLIFALGSRNCPGTGVGRFKYPYGVAVTKEGDIVVADSGNHRIQVFRADGVFVRMWGSEGAGNGQFNWPRSVAVTPSGAEVIVLDDEVVPDEDGYNHSSRRGSRRVQVFRLSDGAFLRKWKGPDVVTLMAIPPGGDVCVTAANEVRGCVLRLYGTWF